MKPFIAVATFVVISLKGVVGSALKSGASSLCPSAVVTNSTIFSVGGNEINRTTFVCPDDDLAALVASHVPYPATRTPISVFNKSRELVQRSVGECRTPVPECQCGQTTFCSCDQVTPSPPDGSDCQTLVRSLVVLPEVAGPTFVVPAQGSQLLQFHTCAMLWSNMMTNGSLEYCWDELSEITTLVNQNCLTQAVSTGGACDTIQHIWTMQMFRVGT